MEITLKDNCIFIDNNKVSNFSIENVHENIYSINNGVYKAYCYLTSSSLQHFKAKTFTQGDFVFTGNTKQLHAILDHVNFYGSIIDKQQSSLEQNKVNMTFSELVEEIQGDTNKAIPFIYNQIEYQHELYIKNQELKSEKNKTEKRIEYSKQTLANLFRHIKREPPFVILKGHSYFRISISYDVTKFNIDASI